MSMKPYRSPADTTAHYLAKRLYLSTISSRKQIRVCGSRTKKQLLMSLRSSVPRVKCRLLVLCYWSVLITSHPLLHITSNRNMFHLRRTWEFRPVLICRWFVPPKNLSRSSNASNGNSKYPLRRTSGPPPPFTPRMVLVPRWTIHPLRPRPKWRRSNRRASLASNSGVRGQTPTSYSLRGRCLSNSSLITTYAFTLPRRRIHIRGATLLPRPSHTLTAKCFRLQEGMVSSRLPDPPIVFM